MKYYIDVLKKYAVFTGRASRREFWMFALFNLIISSVLSIFDSLAGANHTFYMSAGFPIKLGYIQNLYGLVVFLPNIAVSVRRLHDVNRSGKLLLWLVAPLVLLMLAILSGAYIMIMFLFLVFLGFAIWLLVLNCTEGTHGPNKYGKDPYGNSRFKFSFEEDPPAEEQ